MQSITDFLFLNITHVTLYVCIYVLIVYTKLYLPDTLEHVL